MPVRLIMPFVRTYISRFHFYRMDLYWTLFATLPLVLQVDLSLLFVEVLLIYQPLMPVGGDKRSYRDLELVINR
jgi:hypothetical protein